MNRIRHWTILLFACGALLMPSVSFAQDPVDAWNQLQQTIYLLMEVRQLYEAGKYDEAISVAEKALAIERRVIKEEKFAGADFSFDLMNYPAAALARLHHAKGDYVRAEAEYQRLISSAEQAHSKLPGAYVRSDLAAVYESKGDYARALELRTQANEIIEDYLTYRFSPRFISQATDTWGSLSEKATRDALAMGASDSFRQRLLDSLEAQAFETVSLHVRFMSQDARAAQLALTTILRRKGRLASTSGEQINVLRRYGTAEDQQLISGLTRFYANIAAMSNQEGAVVTLKTDDLNKTAGPNKIDDFARKLWEQNNRALALGQELDALEGKINQRTAELRPAEPPATLVAVRQALPADAALIELFVYEPFDPRGKKVRYPTSMSNPQRGRLEVKGSAYGPPRYVAYVLHADRDAPAAVDLGPTADIDREVIRLREALRDPKRSDVKELARALDERIMRPVRNLLGSTRRLFIVPDGNLTLIPFNALVSEKDRYLVEDYSISYLTGWRDLVRRLPAVDSHDAPKVFGDPSFGSSEAKTLESQRSRAGSELSKELKNLKYDSLPGTALEAAALSKLFPEATILTRGRATEAMLKTVKRPRFLHIATHGFFLADEEELERSSAPDVYMKFDVGINTAVRQFFPLLRSGLILTGVNERSSGQGEDGVLTALEVSGLDLLGTKLVVLSACETGLGAVKNGEGVFGLRRALVVAGSETQVMTLWRVSDASARDLMVAYYTRLKNSEGRGEALRQVQLAMLQGKLTGSEPAPRTRETVDKTKPVVDRDYSHPYYWASFIISGDVRNLAGQN